MEQTQVIMDAAATPPATVSHLTNGQKAAVIVRLLLSEGAAPRLAGLSTEQQERLVRRMGQLSHVNRATVAAITREFAESLDAVGLTFPRGIPGALKLLENHLSETARTSLQVAAEAEGPADPWARLAAMSPDRLRPLVERESAEICAIMLAKLPVARAASLLAELPQDRAYIIAHAVSLTGSVAPDTIDRVGETLMAQLEAQPAPAFGGDAAERVGAILNAATAVTREKVLEGLDTRDTVFAEHVRKAIFTFDHIPKRLEPRDIPKVMRGVEAETTARALAAGMASAPVAVEFILENMSKRMAEQLREDAEARGKVPGSEGEAAMAEVVTSIRRLEQEGEIRLIEPEE